MDRDDDLRDKLTGAIRAETIRRGVGVLGPNLAADALMPVIREALAAAWDHGHRTANPVIPDTHRDVINPWKQP